MFQITQTKLLQYSMATPLVTGTDMSDTTVDTRSNSHDSDENGWQEEVEGKDSQLIAKKNTTSMVWKSFGFVTSEDGTFRDSDTLKCRLCHKGVSAK